MRECMICYSKFKNDNNTYFKCKKIHYICIICINKIIYNNNREKFAKNDLSCPLCKAPPRSELKQPSKLDPSENILDPELIPLTNIFIHQNFILDRDVEILNVINKNGDKNDEILELYTKDGSLIMYIGMFVASNGFFYSYNKHKKSYILAVKKDKYQFWDVTRMYKC